MIILLISHRNHMMCVTPSSQPSLRDSSDEGSQHVLCRINKNYPLLSPNTPSYLELSIISMEKLSILLQNYPI